MSETIKTTEHYYTKEFNSYNNSENNFVANQELTITITLNEYRKLIQEVARKEADIEEAKREKWKAQNVKSDLEKEIETLREKIYQLQNPESTECEQ